MVILGGTTKPEISAARGQPVSDIGIDPLITGAMLARRYPTARIIYSGGSPELRPDVLREADYALQILSGLGVPNDRVEVEGRSRNTAENAAFSKKLASPAPSDRWLLVTSAYHMPPSCWAFSQSWLPNRACTDRLADRRPYRGARLRQLRLLDPFCAHCQPGMD